MAPITVRPTRVDVEIADAIAAHTGPRTEQAAELITWGADEHVLCALAVGWWLYSRSGDSASRGASNHVLMTTLVSSALPHILKKMFDQERPDRLTVRGHWRGVPLSGKRLDAFPSGHAVHIGALASAASVLPSRQRNTLWAIGAGLVLTRIVLLAHWTSDVAAGLIVGALTERLIRRFTGQFPHAKTLARPRAFKFTGRRRRSGGELSSGTGCSVLCQSTLHLAAIRGNELRNQCSSCTLLRRLNQYFADSWESAP